MNTETAEAVVKTYESFSKTAIDGKMGEAIGRAWLRARGVPMDRYGKYVSPSGTTRFIFKETSMRRESLTEGGRWVGMATTPYIEVGTNLLRQAAEALGRADLIERVEKLSKKRKEGVEKRAAKASKKELEDAAKKFGVKAAIQSNPKEFIRVLDMIADGKVVPQDRVDRVNAVTRAAVEEATRRLEHGETLDDGAIVSVDNPPWGALLRTHLDYEWTAVEGGVEYTVRFKPVERGVAEVSIGKSSEHGGFTVSAITRRMSMDFNASDDVGDGILAGAVFRDKKGAVGAKVFLISVHERRSGAGTRLLSLWCRLMSSFGVEAWKAEAVGDEGLGAMEAWARKGKIEILGKIGESNLAVRCIEGTPGLAAGRAPKVDVSLSEKLLAEMIAAQAKGGYTVPIVSGFRVRVWRHVANQKHLEGGRIEETFIEPDLRSAVAAAKRALRDHLVDAADVSPPRLFSSVEQGQAALAQKHAVWHFPIFSRLKKYPGRDVG